MTPALIGLAVEVAAFGVVALIRPWQHLDTDQVLGGFPCGPFMWMGMFGLIGMGVAIVVQVLHLLVGWPGLTYSEWEGLL